MAKYSRFVSVDHNLVVTGFEHMLPLFESGDNREHLFVMDVVKLSRVVCDRVQAVVFANLGEDGADYYYYYISFNACSL